MIELSKLNGDCIYINEHWIETVEALPDTTITIKSGNKYVVLEPMRTVLKEIRDWYSQINQMGRSKRIRVKQEKDDNINGQVSSL